MIINSDYAILIYEEQHGLIGEVQNVSGVIDFLCKEGWIKESTKVFFENKWETVQVVYGKIWRKYFNSCTLDELRDIFDGYLYFIEEY